MAKRYGRLLFADTAAGRHGASPALGTVAIRRAESAAVAPTGIKGVRVVEGAEHASPAGGNLFSDKSPLQLEDSEKKAVRLTLAGDIYTVTRIRLPLLLRLDELLSGGSAVYNWPITSVEHVLPQNPRAGSHWLTDFQSEADREKWVHRLANLVLLTRRKNSQAGNLDFPEKKSKYFSTKAGVSNFALTSKVLAEKAWTPETLERRQSELIGAVEKLWRLT